MIKNNSESPKISYESMDRQTLDAIQYVSSKIDDKVAKDETSTPVADLRVGIREVLETHGFKSVFGLIYSMDNSALKQFVDGARQESHDRRVGELQSIIDAYDNNDTFADRRVALREALAANGDSKAFRTVYDMNNLDIRRFVDDARKSLEGLMPKDEQKEAESVLDDSDKKPVDNMENQVGGSSDMTMARKSLEDHFRDVVAERGLVWSSEYDKIVLAVKDEAEGNKIAKANDKTDNNNDQPITPPSLRNKEPVDKTAHVDSSIPVPQPMIRQSKAKAPKHSIDFSSISDGSYYGIIGMHPVVDQKNVQPARPNTQAKHNKKDDKPNRRRKWLLGAGAVAAAVAVGVGAWFGLKNGGDQKPDEPATAPIEHVLDTPRDGKVTQSEMVGFYTSDVYRDQTKNTTEAQAFEAMQTDAQKAINAGLIEMRWNPNGTFSYWSTDTSLSGYDRTVTPKIMQTLTAQSGSPLEIVK